MDKFKFSAREVLVDVFGGFYGWTNPSGLHVQIHG
jgi:hypothetical protein